jgi:hypothetical protein
MLDAIFVDREKNTTFKRWLFIVGLALSFPTILYVADYVFFSELHGLISSVDKSLVSASTWLGGLSLLTGAFMWFRERPPQFRKNVFRFGITISVMVGVLVLLVTSGLVPYPRRCQPHRGPAVIPSDYVRSCYSLFEPQFRYYTDWEIEWKKLNY